MPPDPIIAFPIPVQRLIAKKVLTAAEIIDMLDNDVWPVIVEAPGEGKVIIPLNPRPFIKYRGTPPPENELGEWLYSYEGVDVDTNPGDGLDPNDYRDYYYLGADDPEQNRYAIIRRASEVENKALVLVADDGNDGDIDPRGPITDSAVNTFQPGSGYAPGDTFTVTDDSGDAVGEVDTVDSGAVTAFHLTSPGTFYERGPSATAKLSGGGDDTLQIIINEVDDSDVTMTVWCPYVIADVG
jgi:hypothetical protein